MFFKRVMRGHSFSSFRPLPDTKQFKGYKKVFQDRLLRDESTQESPATKATWMPPVTATASPKA